MKARKKNPLGICTVGGASQMVSPEVWKFRRRCKGSKSRSRFRWRLFAPSEFSLLVWPFGWPLPLFICLADSSSFPPLDRIYQTRLYKGPCYAQHAFLSNFWIKNYLDWRSTLWLLSCPSQNFGCLSLFQVTHPSVPPRILPWFKSRLTLIWKSTMILKSVGQKFDGQEKLWTKLTAF